MLKVTFKIKGTYSLKENDDGHLMARTMTHFSRATIRGALLATAFKYKGRHWTKDHFHEIKNAMIFPQEPSRFHVQPEKRALLTGNAIQLGVNPDPKKKASITPTSKEEVDSITTVGIREYLYTDTLSFYIDEIIEDVVELLSNITRIGNSESIVTLKSVEKVKSLDRILIPVATNETLSLDKSWVTDEDYDYRLKHTYDVDWTKNTKFEQVDAYSPKYKRKSVRFKCKVIDIEL